VSSRFISTRSAKKEIKKNKYKRKEKKKEKRKEKSKEKRKKERKKKKIKENEEKRTNGWEGAYVMGDCVHFSCRRDRCARGDSPFEQQ
jgi:transposase